MKKDIINSLLFLVGILIISVGLVYVAEQSVENPVESKYHEESTSDDNYYSPTWMPINIGGQTYLMPF